MNSALVPLLLFTLLPLQLLSFGCRLLRKPLDWRFSAARLVLFVVSIPILLSPIFAFPNPGPSKDIASSSELEKLKLQITHLESILQENAGILNTKVHHLDEYKKLVESLELKVNFLESSLGSLKRADSSCPSYTEVRISSLEEEVRLLWAESRENNFDIHVLESKASDAATTLEDVTSEVEKMDNIITEQWIQIRQLEQALQMTKIMTANVHKKSASKVQGNGKNMKYPILEFMKGILRPLREVVGLPDSFWLGNPFSSSHITQLLDLLRRIISAAKAYHYELQSLVKQALETNGFVVAFANEEFIFFLASAIFVFPFFGALTLCWSVLSQPE
ncbi:hypothetical protein J5N97_028251 [Dioscorea zingiberensis]|uniref:Uncharacterized protein n=1 Tax=Dioscorea zingiberensis TaxID=325984 RepID=A0A9D5BYR8_9LILI|nr:hypothetical protein J5N97_028251 [Dioscorea zingiberensis]